MKNKMIVWMALFLALFCGAVRAEYWAEDAHSVSCVDGRTGCQVLQMVMMGSFAELDLSDSLGTRVLSAVLPMLCGITEQDFEHFCENFDVEEDIVERLYYAALGNCLLADMQFSQNESEMKTAARRVLRLFLDPESEEEAKSQIAEIRSQLDEDMIEMIAKQAGVPEDFVESLMRPDEDEGEENDREDREIRNGRLATARPSESLVTQSATPSPERTPEWTNSPDEALLMESEPEWESSPDETPWAESEPEWENSPDETPLPENQPEWEDDDAWEEYEAGEYPASFGDVSYDD